MEKDLDLLSKIIFSDDATSQLHCKVDRHNLRIWGTQNPHNTLEIDHNSTKVSVFCGIKEKCEYNPVFFEGLSITGYTYLEMLQTRLLPRLKGGEGWSTAALVSMSANF